MKRLKLTQEQENSFIESIRKKIRTNFRTTGTVNLSLDKDVIAEINKPPENVKLPQIYVTAAAYVKMLELVRQSSIEISWHGLVKRDIETNTYLIYDILIFPQINSATTTTADEEGFAKWQTELLKDMNFPIEDLRLHGHSHVNMNVFSSGVDDQYQSDLLHKVEDGDYYIFLIFNKKTEICALIYDYAQNVMFESDDISFDVIGDNNEEIRKWAAYSIQENCREQRIVPAKRKQEYYYGYDYFEDDDWDTPLIGRQTKKIIGGKRKNGSK